MKKLGFSREYSNYDMCELADVWGDSVDDQQNRLRIFGEKIEQLSEDIKVYANDNLKQRCLDKYQDILGLLVYPILKYMLKNVEVYAKKRDSSYLSDLNKTFPGFKINIVFTNSLVVPLISFILKDLSSEIESKFFK